MDQCDNDSEKICIVGAGLVGTLMSVYLAERGFRIDLFEKRPDLRRADIPGGRSIVMSISSRGLRALEIIGMRDEVLARTIPKYSRLVHRANGSVSVQRYGGQGQSINAVDRKLLNCQLLDRAEKTGRVTIRFSHRCEKINPETGEATFTDKSTGDNFRQKYSRIIGADGISSRVRETLEKAGLIKGEIFSPDHGYRELVIPADKNGAWALPKNHVHVWPRKNFFLIAMPQPHGSFTDTLFLPKTGEISFESIRTEKDIETLFSENFPGVFKLMPTLAHDFFTNPYSDIFSVRCHPWHYRDKVVILGDAAHAFVPFFGMGMNVCFEDARILLEILESHEFDWGRAFEEFSRTRKPDTDAITDLSLRNFRDIGKSPDISYDLRWALERKIWEIYPECWMPTYVMIAFSHIPLSEVARRIAVQNEILNRILEKELELDLENACALKETIHKYLDPTSAHLAPLN